MIRSYQGKTQKVHPTTFVSEFAYVVGDVEVANTVASGRAPLSGATITR